MPYSGSQVDEQVVKMSFDNSNFDGNINDSIKALNSLDNSLKILNKNDFSSLTTNLDNLTRTFSVKGQIMLGVLTSLGNKIFDLGNKAFRKLTQGIRDGIGEYNTIIESTESIYQNVKQNGNSLQDVNNALDELNDYADKTIYNFGQMTRMIGMFASAGVGLKSSVSTIKGLANSAALVGANMQKAQMAWNAVSRAMSSGKFTNITWRSLELSGIAGKQFNKVITEVARTMKVKGKQTGKDIDGMIKKWGSLRESLREGWLTKDVFTQAMDIMSGAMSDAELKTKGYTNKQIKELREIANAAEEAATRVKTFKQLMDTIGEAIGSGWAQSFRILIGDLEDAKKLYTRISNVISDFIDNNAEIRNKLFKQIVNGKDKGVDGKWKSGRDNFRQIIENMLAIVKTFLKSVKTGFYNIFPIERISAAARKLLGVVENFTRAFTLNLGLIQKDGQIAWDTSGIDSVTNHVQNLIKFFRGLASAVDIAWMAISQPIKAIIKRIPFFENFYDNVNTGLLGIIKKLGIFGDKITAFRDAVKDWEIFGYLTDYFLDNIDELGKKYPVLGAILWIFNGIGKALKNLKKGFGELNIKPLSAAFGLFKMVVTAIWRVLNGLFDLLRNAKNSVDWSWLDGPKKALINFIKTLSDYGRGLISFEQATGKLGVFLGNIFSSLGKLFSKNDVSKKIVKASHEIDKQYSNLNTTITNTGKKVESVWEKITNFFKPVSDLFKKLNDNGNLTFDNFAKKIALIGGGVAAATISVSHLVKTFGKIKIIDNINNLLTAGIDVIKAYQKEAQSKAILNIAVAIGILAISLTALSFIPYENLENGLVIFTSFMAVLSMTLPPIINSIARFNNSISSMNESEKPLNAFIKTLGKFGKQISSGINARMIGKMFKDIAIGILILVGAISALVLLFKYDRDNTITSIKALAKIIGILTIAVGGLVIAMNLFSKSAKNTKTSIDTFSQFFKLSGVARVILALAASVFIFVGALAIMTKLDSNKLYDSWALLMAIIGFLGLIMMSLASIISKAKDLGKLKKISITLSGALFGMAAIIAAFAYLNKQLQKDNTNRFSESFFAIAGLMAMFITTYIGLAEMAKKIGGGKTGELIWRNLKSTIIILTSCLLALAGGLYALSYAKSIPASIVALITILTLSMSALIGFIAVVVSKSKSTFTSNLVKILQGIAISISAIISSIGVMAAGIALLVSTIASFDVSQSDANKASNNVVNRLEYVAEVIAKALPNLRKIFYSIGTSVGTVFTSFTTGFVDQVISVGKTYNNVAEKFVNLIIDLVGKIVTILKSRKEDIARIIGDVVDFLGTEIAAAVNAFFKKSDGSGAVTSEQVLGFLGIAGVTIGSGKVVFEGIKNYNALASAIDHTGDSVEHLKNLFNKLSFELQWQKAIATEYGEGIFSSFVKTADSVKFLGSNAGNAAASCVAILVAILAIAVAIIALRGAWKRWTGEVQDSYNKTDSWFTKVEQVIVDGCEALGRFFIQFGLTIARGLLGIVTWLIAKVTALISWPITLIADTLYSLFGWEWAKGVTDKLGNYIHGMEDIATKSFGSIITGWKNIANEDAGLGLEFFDKNLDKNLEEANKKVYEGTKEIGENAKQGEIDGLDGLEKTLVDINTSANEAMIAGTKATLEIASPSKVAYSLYWNYILGAKNALSAGGQELVKVMESNNKKLIKKTLTGVKDLGGAYRKLGVNQDKRSGLNKYDNVNYTEKNADGSTVYKTVNLNKKLTESILAEAEALRGLSKEEAFSYINQKNMNEGLGASIREISDLTNFLYDQHEDRTTLWWDSVTNLQKETTLGWGAVLSAEEQASMEAVNKQQETNGLLIESAEELKKKLIGKKKEQAAEILKQDLIQKGMSEEQAEEEANKMVALIVAKQKNKTKIEQKGLDNAITIMKAERDAYEESVKEQTAILEEELAKREKATALATKAMTEVETKGFGKTDKNGNYSGMTVSELAQKLKEKVEANNRVNIAKSKLDQIVADAAKRLEKNGMFNSNQFKKDYEDAYKKANTTQKKSGNIADTLNKFFKDALGKIPKAPDLTTWSLPKTNTGNNLKDDGKKAVNASKDLKNNLEKNRADLTPTIDLDKLSDEAKKANGIVTSSLMAAQNASIGDYINKDSELNPFMKDRWQNVYNFTQNNYSPKALSRTDIYRQTKRQINLSRGF